MAFYILFYNEDDNYFVENPCGTIQCQTGEECCKTCNEQGNLVPASHCESNLNGNPGCPMPLCVPKGTCFLRR